MILLAVGEKTNGVWPVRHRYAGDSPVTLHVQDNSVSYERLGRDKPRCSAGIGRDAFVRLLWGPARPRHGDRSRRVRVDGDRDRALALQRLYRGVLTRMAKSEISAASKPAVRRPGRRPGSAQPTG